jgi:hypothetical protein
MPVLESVSRVEAKVKARLRTMRDNNTNWLAGQQCVSSSIPTRQSAVKVHILRPYPATNVFFEENLSNGPMNGLSETSSEANTRPFESQHGG